MKDGAPTKALEGFARGAGAKIEDLTIVHDGKQDVYAYEYVQTGKPLGELLEDIINAAVKNCRFLRSCVGAAAHLPSFVLYTA